MAARLTSDDLLLRDVSIVVPAALGDEAWRTLLPDLAGVSSGAEVVVAAAGPAPPDCDDVAKRCGLRAPLRWSEAPPGRARQMNRAAGIARGRFLWFLHADSRVAPAALAALDGALRQAPAALHYFDLAFLDDGPRWMRLNQWGVRFRSRVLGLPFGDQGFCMSRELFDALGGFDESAPFGEDHLLVWAARRRGVPLRCTGVQLATSSRKYRRRGWLRTTARHLALTLRQAIPQWLRLLKERLT